MRNYLKVIRVRQIVQEFAAELPIEHYVFFDDEDLAGVSRAMRIATQHVAEMTIEGRPSRLSIFRAVPEYPTVQRISEGL